MIQTNLLRMSPISLATMVLLSLLLVVVGVGLFALLSAALGGLAVAPLPPKVVAAPDATPLLLAILVLLVLVAVLLLLLLLCCFKRSPKAPPELARLLALLPLLTRVPEALRKTSIALRQSASALHWINGKLESAGAHLNLGELFASGLPPGASQQLPIPRLSTVDVAGVPTNDGPRTGKLITGIDLDAKVDFTMLRDKLSDAGSSLQEASISTGGTLQTLEADITAAANVLGDLAAALNAPP